MSELASTPIARNAPCQFDLGENYEADAVIVRIHHCYAEAGDREGDVALTRHEAAASRWGGSGEEPGPDERDFWRRCEAGGGALESAGRSASRRDRKGATWPPEAARLALMGSDAPTRFKGAPGERSGSPGTIRAWTR